MLLILKNGGGGGGGRMESLLGGVMFIAPCAAHDHFSS